MILWSRIEKIDSEWFYNKLQKNECALLSFTFSDVDAQQLQEMVRLTEVNFKNNPQLQEMVKLTEVNLKNNPLTFESYSAVVDFSTAKGITVHLTSQDPHFDAVD